MTRSAQQPPASSGGRPEHRTEAEGETEAGSGTLAGAGPQTGTTAGDDPKAANGPKTGTRAKTGTGAKTGTAAAAEPEGAAGSEPATEPEPEAEPGSATRTTAEAGEAEPAAQRTATPQGSSSEPADADAPGTATPPDAEAGTVTGSDGRTQAADGEAEPGAAAAAKSRLPALVRTMTQTAIDRPREQAAPVGRPGKAVLAGAAVAGALLVSVPFLVLGGNHDDGDDRTKVAGAGTVLGDDGQEAPGDFVVASPDNSPSGTAGKTVTKPAPHTPAGHPGTGGGESHPATAAQDRPEAPAKGTGGAKTGGSKSTSKSGGGSSGGGSSTKRDAKAGSGVTFSAPVSFRSHLSGRCIDVPDGDFSDGKQLWVWDCNNTAAQKWQFASDGTIRIGGKCLDVAGANYNDGTPIQIAWCNGNAAQQFTLNGSHDLVNTVVGKCVDIKDVNPGNAAPLHLWTCIGADNQKWSV
ncbi:RICIN domain-containing protein [Streptomyces longwoodensis]|uniref:RICIN domain-containing protein n=1 Tax=Streptomyces longwoodensis TaxID=68231 RepID=UPI0033F1EBA5